MLATGMFVGLSLREVMQMLGAINRDGCLTLTNKKENGRVFFNRGTIVDVKIDGELGWKDVLAGEGLIDRREQEAGEDGESVIIPPVMLEGSVGAEEAISKWFVDEVFSIFSWPDVSYEFEVSDAPKSLGPGIPVTVETLLRGIDRCEEEWHQVYEVIPSLSSYVTLVDSPEVNQDITLNLEDWKIILKLRMPVTINELKKEFGCPTLRLCQRLVALEQRGLIGFTDEVELDEAAPAGAKKGKYVRRDDDNGVPLEWLSYCNQLDGRSFTDGKPKAKVTG